MFRQIAEQFENGTTKVNERRVLLSATSRGWIGFLAGLMLMLVAMNLPVILTFLVGMLGASLAIWGLSFIIKAILLTRWVQSRVLGNIELLPHQKEPDMSQVPHQEYDPMGYATYKIQMRRLRLRILRMIFSLIFLFMLISSLGNSERTNSTENTEQHTPHVQVDTQVVYNGPHARR